MACWPFSMQSEASVRRDRRVGFGAARGASRGQLSRSGPLTDPVEPVCAVPRAADHPCGLPEPLINQFLTSGKRASGRVRSSTFCPELG